MHTQRPTRNTNMKRALFFSGAITAIVVGVFTLAYITTAASTKASFVGRGIVRTNTLGQKTIDVHFSHLNAAAADLGLGKILTVSVSTAKILKGDAAGTLRRITQGNLAVGDEVSIVGKIRADGRFVAGKVVVRLRPFVIRGTLKTFNVANRRMTVDVTSSSYRPIAFKGGTVTIRFDTNLTVYSEGQRVEASDITAGNQTVRVEGTVVNTDEFEATTMWQYDT